LTCPLFSDLKIPLNPPFSKGETKQRSKERMMEEFIFCSFLKKVPFVPLFGKEGLEEIFGKIFWKISI